MNELGQKWKNRLVLGLILMVMAGMQFQTEAQTKYEPSWNSLKNIRTPQWLRDGKFGIYTHWGIYAVPAQGPNATWYANQLYTKPDGPERKYHEATYGKLENFGYKDFIPMFTGEKFNAEEWADLFERAGARFAGPVAEHHDGFSMWDTKYSEWNAAKMGPKRDVVGELSKAIKKHNLKFVTAFHHAESWFYFPTWDKRYDCGDPKYSGLYGPIHEKGALPTEAFLDQWKGKIVEVIDKYDPDFIWFDFGLELVTDSYKQEMLAYYYNNAIKNHKEVVVSYKGNHLPPGTGLLDLELGQEADLTYYEWITDTSIDDGQGWGYVKGLGFKSVDNLIDNLVDRVSKNGYLLLNVGPKPDGSIPEEAKVRLLAMGDWLKINGDAIYGTTCWVIPGEGPTKLESGGGFNEKNDLVYTGKDIRFTVKDNKLFAIVLDWPGDKLLIKSLAPQDATWAGLYPSEIESITMLGDGAKLKWEMTKEGLTIETPKTKPCDHAYVFRIVRKSPFEKLALTPPMGFNSWNAFEAKIDESKIKAIADIMVSSGMRDAGYTYLVLDDGWMAKERDSEGNLMADPEKFPSGMKAIGDYIHSKGLKFGIYECRGFKTCQGLPGSFKHEEADMNSFASWGVDYIKLDACYAEKTGLLTTEHLKIFHDCIEKTGRPMILSISDFGNGAWAWGGKEFGQLWRTSYDIYPWIESVYHCANTSGGSGTSHPGFNGLWQFAGPGHWNDPDMLQVGNLANFDENRAHFSLWCILAAPLMAGCDLRTMSDTIRRIFTAREVIAINQDPRGLQGYKVYQKGNTEIYNKPLSDGTTAVLLLNKDSVSKDITVTWKMIGLKGSQPVRDLWGERDLGSFNGSFTAKNLPQNGVMLLRVGSSGGSPVAGPVPAPIEKYSITRSGTFDLTKLWYIMKSGDAPVIGKSHEGTNIKIAGKIYPHGMGCKTESRIMYKLNGKASRFQAEVGIDDAYTGAEPGRFRVLIEDAFGNRPVFDSGKILKGTPAVKIDIDVTGLEFILLEFQGKEVIGDWVNPTLIAL